MKQVIILVIDEKLGNEFFYAAKIFGRPFGNLGLNILI
jgi:hypothetical protein